MKGFLLFFGFWLLAVIASVLSSVVWISVVFFRNMMEAGTGDPELMAGEISGVIVGSIMAIIFYTIIAYPLYFLVWKKVKYPNLVVFVGLGILTCFSYEYDVAYVVMKIVALGVFIWLGLSVPRKIIAKRIILNN